MQPHLAIIAGPNGSGKSTYFENHSFELLNKLKLLAYDFDLELSKLYNQFSIGMNEQIEQNLANRAKELFNEKLDSSLKNKSNFSFQTNFNLKSVDQIRENFSNQNFQTHLIFLYVNEERVCFERVEKRVQEGGHFVSKKEIKSRYINGLKNLDAYWHMYDNVSIIDTTPSTNLLIFQMKNGKLNVLDPSILRIVKKQSLNNLGQFIEQHLLKL